MTEEVNAVKLSIKYKDVCHMKELYKLMFFWMQDNEWIDPVYKASKNFETSYIQKDSSSGAQEHLFVWELEKIPNESAYFKFKMKVTTTTIQLKDVEVMYEGKKIKAQKGEILIKINANLVLDYKDEWDKSWFLKNFGNFWRKRLYKNNILQFKQMLKDDAETFGEAIKKYLNLKGFLIDTEQEPFYTSRSYA